jgi:hypothetical protein
MVRADEPGVIPSRRDRMTPGGGLRTATGSRGDVNQLQLPFPLPLPLPLLHSIWTNCWIRRPLIVAPV